MASREDMYSGTEMSDLEKELFNMINMSDDELYRTIGSTAKNSNESPSVGSQSTGNSSFGGSTGTFSPSIFADLPDDPLEAGRKVCTQLEGYLDKIICETVTHSSLFGYKQEALRLAMRCVDAIEKKYPTVDPTIDKAYVAFHVKERFNKCNRW